MAPSPQAPPPQPPARTCVALTIGASHPPQALPTLDEIYRVIPLQGIQINAFAARFIDRARISGEEGFRALMSRASMVATIDSGQSRMWPKPRPTSEEVRAAIPRTGIHVEDLAQSLRYHELSDTQKGRTCQFLDQLAILDAATWTINLKNSVTAEEIVAAIPGEGITRPELLRKFDAVLTHDSDEFWHFMRILSQVAVWDLVTERIFVRAATA